MHSLKLLLALTALAMVADGFFIDGGITVTGGGLALAALLGIKAAAIGGFAIGSALSRRRSYGRRSYGRSYGRRSHRRYGRSVEEDDVSELLLDASRDDADDCAKKLVCSLNAVDASTLAQDEAAIAALFGKAESLDVTSVSVEFDLAAHMGRKAGADHCALVYGRCPYNAQDLMQVIRQPNMYNNQI